MGEIDPIFERAKVKQARYDSAVERTTDLFVGWSKWLNGSLFAVNGAGLIAVSQSLGDVPVSTKTAAPFALGIVLALLSAALLQEYYDRSLPLVRRLRDYWTLVVAGMKRSIRFERKLKAMHDDLFRWAWLPPFFGWASGISFVIGLWQFSSHLGA